MDEKTTTDFNMSLQDLMVIDGARRDAEMALEIMRKDARMIDYFLDMGDLIYRTILPTTTHPTMIEAYRRHKELFIERYDELREIAVHEVKRANNTMQRDFVRIGAKEATLVKCRRMLSALYALKDQAGLGFRQKHSYHAGIKGSG